MPKMSLICIVTCLLLISCTVDRQSDKGIDYGELNELSTNLILEIGNNDEFLPGELRQMLLMKDGTLIVSDQRKGTIEQLNPDGSFITTVAAQGEGPGELPQYFTLFSTGDHSFGVWSDNRRQLDLFKADVHGVYQYDESIRAQSAATRRLEIIGQHDDHHFFALTGQPDWELIKLNNPDYRQTPVSLVDRSLDIVEDSKHTLQFPNSLFGDPSQYRSQVSMNGMAFLGTPPFRYRDRLRLLGNGRYMIAQPEADRANFVIYDENHNPEQQLEVEIAPVRVEQEDLDFAFSHLSGSENQNTRRALEERVEDQKPAFLNVFASERYLWLHTNLNETGRQFVVLDFEGNPAGTFYLEEFEELQVVTDDRLYLLNNNPEKGHTIRVYEIQI